MIGHNDCSGPISSQSQFHRSNSLSSKKSNQSWEFITGEVSKNKYSYDVHVSIHPFILLLFAY